MLAGIARRLTIVTMLLCAIANASSAQCPNGAPPPCALRPTPTLREVPNEQPRLTTTYENTPLRVVRTELARLLKRTIIATPAADTVRMTARIADQRWDVALKALLDANQLDGTEDTTGIIVIKTLEEVRRDAANVPIVLRIVKLDRPAEPVASIARRLLSPAGWLEVDTLTNTLVINERADVMERVVLTILELNRRPPKP
jgi:hypothetical protein